MTRTRVMIVVAFLVAFAAGGACAMALHPFERPRDHGHSWLTTELELSADQQQQMLAIWANVDKGSPRDDAEKRHAMQKQRDEAIRKLIPEDKQQEFDKIMDGYSKQTAEMAEARRKAFETAVEKTKAILTSDQRKKYEQILADRPDPRHGHGGQGFGWPRPEGQATQPSSMTAPSGVSGGISGGGVSPEAIQTH